MNKYPKPPSDSVYGVQQSKMTFKHCYVYYIILELHVDKLIPFVSSNLHLKYFDINKCYSQ